MRWPECGEKLGITCRKTVGKAIFPGVSPGSKQGRVDGVARIALLSAPVAAPMLRLPFQTGAFAALAACGGRAWFGRGHGHCPAFPRRFRGGGAARRARRLARIRHEAPAETGRGGSCAHFPRRVHCGMGDPPPSCAASCGDGETTRGGVVGTPPQTATRKTGKPPRKKYFRVCHLKASRGGWTGLHGLRVLFCRRAGCRARLRRTQGGDGMPTSPALSAGCRYDAARHAEMPVSGTFAGCGWNARNARTRRGRNRKQQETAF